MEWRGEGVLIAVRRHGENAAIIEVFTPDHGRHAGVVRGGASRKMSPVLQPGAQLDVTWRARLEDHLGGFTVEPLKSRSAQVMDDRRALAGLNAICGLLSFALPERDPHPELYDRSIALIDRLGIDPDWPTSYLEWEVALLEDMGFGLDLSACAVTGSSEGLAFVSPKSGRAVSSDGAGEWADKLLPLPPALRELGSGQVEGLAEAFGVTGFFLVNWMAKELGQKPLPAARQRLMDLLTRP